MYEPKMLISPGLISHRRDGMQMWESVQLGDNLQGDQDY